VPQTTLDGTASGLDEWISRDYRKPKTIKQVNTRFLKQSR